jgi:putative MATE family efflux protein
MGTLHLAAISLTFPVVMTTGSVAVGLGVGVSAVISRAVGRGDTALIRRLTTDSLTLSLLVVALFIAVGMATIDPLFRAMGADEQSLPLIRSFMRIWYPGMIFLVTPMIGNNAIRASGDTVWPSLLTIVSAGINIVLDPLMIFGLWGFPRMGIAGAATATVIARAMSLLGAIWILHVRKRMLSLDLPRMSEVIESWGRILHIGLPAIGAAVIIPAASGVLTAMLARYGPASVAAFGVATRIESFSMVAIYALSASLVPFLGQNFGAGMVDRMREGIRAAVAMCLLWGLFTAALLQLTAGTICRWFVSDPAVIRQAVEYLRWVPISFALQGVALVASAALNAIGRPLPATLLTLLRMVILTIPLAWLGCWWLGPRGILGAVGLANAVAGIGALLWIRRQWPA